MPKSGFRSESHEMIEEINKSQNYYWSIIKWRAKKPKGESNVKFFPLVLFPVHELTNQQFVNCAYLKIQAIAPTLPVRLCETSPRAPQQALTL
jgi:hypothetical protein